MWQDQDPNQSRRSVWSLMSGSLVDSVSEVAVAWESVHRWVSSGSLIGVGVGISGFGSLESGPHVGLWRVGSGSIVDSWVGRGFINDGVRISWGVWGVD